MNDDAAHLKRHLVIVSLSMLACLLLARIIYLYFDDANAFPINTIKIVASYQHITHEQLKSVLEPYQQRSFYTLPIHRLYHQLSTLPWTKKVEIERLFPNTIKIVLEEKKPVAIWNNQVLTDDGASLADPAAAEQLTGLPHIVSSSQEVQTVLTMYEIIKKILIQNRLYVKVIVRRDNQAWEITLTNGIRLKLGKQDTLARVERFNRAYPILAERPGQIVQIDLRYPKGMAVKWEKG